MSHPFKLRIRVRYAECDAQQVVFNGRYADYADLAATEFMRAALGGYQKLLDRGLDTQVVNLTIDWQQSARFDDVLDIQVEVSHMGNTSYALSMSVLSHPQQLLIAKIKVVYVLVDTQHYRKCPLPEDFRQALEKGARSVLINQAG